MTSCKKETSTSLRARFQKPPSASWWRHCRSLGICRHPSQSNAAVVQQLAAGSTNIATNAGLVDPIRAIEKGAPIAILRIEIQAPPYALLAKPAIKTMAELKGKTVIVGGAKDITRIFANR